MMFKISVIVVKSDIVCSIEFYIHELDIIFDADVRISWKPLLLKVFAFVALIRLPGRIINCSFAISVSSLSNAISFIAFSSNPEVKILSISKAINFLVLSISMLLLILKQKRRCL